MQTQKGLVTLDIANKLISQFRQPIMVLGREAGIEDLKSQLRKTVLRADELGTELSPGMKGLLLERADHPLDPEYLPNSLPQVGRPILPIDYIMGPEQKFVTVYFATGGRTIEKAVKELEVLLANQNSLSLIPPVSPAMSRRVSVNIEDYKKYPHVELLRPHQ